jgi:hypothetical protein
VERVTELLLPHSKIAIPGDHPDAIYRVRKINRPVIQRIAEEHKTIIWLKVVEGVAEGIVEGGTPYL